MTITIRPVTPADRPQLRHICLLTCDAGQSGEDKHNYPDLPGHIYAEPYATPELGHTWGFVLVDDERESGKEVVGYVIGASDTRKWEADAAEKWWPTLQASETYKPLVSSGADSVADGPLIQPTEDDLKYIKTLKAFPPADEAQIKYSPAHMHIDLIPDYQSQGYGQDLVNAAVTHLKDVSAGQGKLNSVWLGMDPRNTKARGFYLKIGYKPVDQAAETVLGLNFKEWFELYDAGRQAKKYEEIRRAAAERRKGGT
ncbi:hypothetical protein CONPUDRAFT_123106 [Coniophora puteana RWD-64-598 SS2]|uniref:N-acetyltransferase domain-containing protein n=1 Tax=Coniophora puteana (strain RWD-64-598) TaxID=741705 RepID=A0A5M3MT97_CONPW|nr:uncharacterized protein CONPUDRAFT_123106 [Coniophora puteana RWD-64-598 SS2]EIW82316.1 hypothetical protein CONPUDRAFT_123106 [Coniophora puteana RWD-64-598 SS2]